MLENKQEYPCQTIDMSPGGLRVAGPVNGKIGERVVLYFEDFGRLEGIIVRFMPDGFAIAMTLPVSKRERIADLLTWMINQDAADDASNRRHRRITPKQTEASLLLPHGRVVAVKIVDVSISGVGLQTEATPALGTRVDIGKRSGKIVRLFKGGLAIEFSRLIPIDEFDEDIIL
jgi:hypothetical protein